MKINVLDKGFVRLVDHMGDDAAIVQAARVSYGEGTKSVSDDENLIRYMMRNRHTSVFEQVVLKFHVKAPIFVFRQWHRHRTFSYNELSGRYSVLNDEYYIPDEDKVTFQNPTNKQGGNDDVITPFNIKNPKDWWDSSMFERLWDWGNYFREEQIFIRQNYEKYINSGMRRELARINLPVSQYSQMYATCNLHNLFHFLKLRMDSHAQYEIRVYAEAIFDLIKPKFPLACKAFEDYILNSITFSSDEVECLKKILSVNYDQFLIDTIISNKRERSEFCDKLKKISGDRDE